MIGNYESQTNAEQQEKKYLRAKSISKLRIMLLELVANISTPYDKELLIDIIIDMKKENDEM